MDKVQFLQSINFNSVNPSIIVTNYLDQFILLYDLIDFNSGVYVIDNSTKNIVFKIQSDSIIDIKNKLDYQSIFYPYENPIQTQYNIISNNEIIISMSI